MYSEKEVELMELISTINAGDPDDLMPFFTEDDGELLDTSHLPQDRIMDLDRDTFIGYLLVRELIRYRYPQMEGITLDLATRYLSATFGAVIDSLGEKQSWRESLRDDPEDPTSILDLAELELEWAKQEKEQS
jgi:hypothetical protein